MKDQTTRPRPAKLYWSRFTLVFAFLLFALLLGIFVSKIDSAPPEPVYQGKKLREWIAAEPHLPVVSYEDTVSYRRTALLAMGEPAVRYLIWMVQHPRQMLDEHVGLLDRLSRYLPKPLQKRLPGPPRHRANFMYVVIALKLIGPPASATAPDLVRLWESDRNSMYATYNGFPVALAQMGDSSPLILGALHRHFYTPDRLHNGLSAFAAWRLNSKDAEAIAVLRRELAATDSQVHTRYALLDTFGQFAADPKTFLPEIRAVIAGSLAASPNYQTIATKAAWQILKEPEPAQAFVQRLAKEASLPETVPTAVDDFASSAYNLAEVPMVRELSIPVLKQLSHFTNASSAQFASNIMVQLERRTGDMPQVKP